MTLNLVLFTGSCAFVSLSAWYFWRLGPSALTAWIATLSLLANLFVLKQIDLLGFHATASDVFAIGSLLGLNLLQEKYGKKAATTAIWTSFSILVFFVVMAQIHLAYAPSEYDVSQEHFQFLINPAPRIMAASLFTFLIVQQLDVRLYRRLRKKLPMLSPLTVSGITMCLSQLLDTALFSVLGLYGIVHALFDIFLVSYSIKLIAIANTVPWSFMTARFFKKEYHHDLKQSH